MLGGRFWNKGLSMRTARENSVSHRFSRPVRAYSGLYCMTRKIEENLRVKIFLMRWSAWLGIRLFRQWYTPEFRDNLEFRPSLCRSLGRTADRDSTIPQIVGMPLSSMRIIEELASGRKKGGLTWAR